MTTAATSLIGASSSSEIWDSINWDNIKAEVHRLQVRIAKAISEGRHGRVKSLQWILTHSFHAKLLAVRRVVQNQGGKTPGVDNIIWKTPQQKNGGSAIIDTEGLPNPAPKTNLYPKKRRSQKTSLNSNYEMQGHASIALVGLRSNSGI